MGPSPPSPTSSDSDSYNTETARVYFGPMKTPERNFVASSHGLFPPPEAAAALRRSPRLSSPRLRSASPMDVETFKAEREDIDQVELLVNISDEEDNGDLIDSGTVTPQRDDNIDEPSSILANKVLHAHDNPSPPPSPPSALRIFDPYHTTTTESTNDYQSDLMFLNISDGGHQSSLMITSTENTEVEIVNLPAATELSVDGELISIDPVETETSLDIPRQGSLFPSHLTLSVDDLLSKSPSPQKLQAQAQQKDLAAVEAITLKDIVMLSEPDQAEIRNAVENGAISSSTVEIQEGGQADEEVQMANVLQKNTSPAPESLAVTPLRRSTRPRKSVTPNILQETPPIPPAATGPLPSATRVRRKAALTDFRDDVVSDSQDEAESRPLVSQQLGRTPDTVRVRHRSPGKHALSFQRELGSLSPTSSNVLSTLNFTVPNSHTGDGTLVGPSHGDTPMLSFSVFTPPTDPVAPSTPVRTSGPIRFASAMKVGVPSSPSKLTLHPAALNDPTNTPARRVPVSQAIAEGRMISPEKTTESGIRFSNTPLPSVPTPARRVFISEGPPSMAMKTSSLRLASPTRGLGQRAPSAEPVQRLGSSLKGKEKATTQDSLGPMAKLPFPIVAAASTAGSSTITVKPPSQGLSKPMASPAKSSLKQPTSRIPRIGAKPYARAPEVKVTDKPKTIRKVEVTAVKVLPKSASSETASSMRKNVRTVDAPKAPVASSSRVKPTIATASTVLKRKREQDKSSPVKPRVMRQVPQVVIPAAPPPPAPVQTAALDAAPKGKKAAFGTRQIRRVMDPDPPKEVPAPQQPSPPHSEQIMPVASETIAAAPLKLPIPEVVVQAPESPPVEHTDLAPGSPMKQDTSNAQPPNSKPREEPPAFNIPQIVVDGEDSGLRRTTRSKRAPVRDIFTEGSSRQTTTTRRKPAAFHSDDVFSGMSMTALKDLTVSNTVKNQRYLTAKLETEVIRREGLRPESPAVKIRTVLQREQDKRDRQNDERARRRLRRSDGDLGPSSDIEVDVDVEAEGYSSQVDELMDDSETELPKHTRGAGEEVDYVTPERHRHKGTRLFGNLNDIQEDDAPERRVKWDRGLFTTVYLDEVKLGSRQYLKENRDVKGILAPTAKALRLDTLGNLPHAESPLADLVQENVTVKKIIYDDDEAAIVPEVVVKPTKPKGKRK